MATYRILLANPYAIRQDWRAQCYDVKRMFDPILKYSAAYDRIYVRSEYVEPTNFDCDLIIYMVPDSDRSVVGKHFAGETDLEGSDGITHGKMVSGKLVVGSEIFFANLHSLEDRSVIAYHEAMHNILKMGESALHARGGLAAHEVGPKTKRKATNDQLMGQRLAQTAKQWEGGFAAAS